MIQIKKVLQQHPHAYHNTLMWAACCLAFFGFLRCVEFTVPSQAGYNPAIHLSFSDIAVDDYNNPSTVVLSIKQSKTDPLGKGTTITLGATQNTLCPIKALLPYLARRGSQLGPLFICENQHFLTQSAFRSHLMTLLDELGLDASCYNTHSFRIGATTSAESAELSKSQIKTMGRWKSDAYRRYIKPTHAQLATFSKLLLPRDTKHSLDNSTHAH